MLLLLMMMIIVPTVALQIFAVQYSCW